ncbi:MAG TPA: hypothetical protein VK814_14540 [Acidobacteriaceae bacterium]|jgi:hypothetical protein|nr:hypothetical protein [Acidobacteriaceae bacterium]
MRWERVRSVRFRWLLPVVALWVVVVVIALPAVQTYGRLRVIGAQGQNATVRVGADHATISPENFWPFAVNEAVVTHSHALTAMQLPGALVEMPLAIALTNPSLWYPQQLDEWTWSLVEMPLYCLPAWWLVGLGMEGLLGRRRVRWPALLLGSVAWATFVLMLCEYLLGWMLPGRAVEGWVVAGFGLWIVLFGVLPACWVLRGVLRGRRELAS